GRQRVARAVGVRGRPSRRPGQLRPLRAAHPRAAGQVRPSLAWGNIAAMKAFVLTYHSPHVVGEGLALNDHSALATDLELVTRLDCEIVSLLALVAGFFGTQRGIDGRRRVALTFDDGPVYDVEPFVHPEFGPQRGFLGIMRDFLARRGGASQPALSAT